MKLYTEDEVHNLVKIVIAKSTEGFLEWIKSETDIVDIDTKEIIPNSEINIKKDKKSLAQHYIFPLLKEVGIVFKK